MKKLWPSEVSEKFKQISKIRISESDWARWEIFRQGQVDQGVDLPPPPKADLFDDLFMTIC